MAGISTNNRKAGMKRISENPEVVQLREEVRRLNEALDKMSLRLADARKKITKLTFGQEAPRRLCDILCSTRFHLGVAQAHYKQMLAEPNLDERRRRAILGQSNDCMELYSLFKFVCAPEGKDKADPT